jgi:hypothetical protein
MQPRLASPPGLEPALHPKFPNVSDAQAAISVVSDHERNDTPAKPKAGPSQGSDKGGGADVGAPTINSTSPDSNSVRPPENPPADANDHHQPNVPVDDDTADKPGNQKLRPGGQSGNGVPPIGDQTVFPPLPPPPVQQPPAPALFFSLAQAEANRDLARAMLGITGASTQGLGGPAASTGAETATDDIAMADAGEQAAFVGGMEEPLNMALPADSLTPQQSELLGVVLATDVDALTAGVARFFEKLDQLGNELFSAHREFGWPQWVVTLLATGSALVVARQWRRRRTMPELARVNDGPSWTWSLGMTEPPDT